ncbi:hypothetical protein FPV67DRAFT_339324 [Lyophyllum atratum]|nr:hypothetical protein FPV67DRAFT_339324 [Lyophyllum atratum]
MRIFVSGGPSGSLPRLLLSIRHSCPNIRFFSIGMSDYRNTTPEFTSALENLICSLHDLQDLIVNLDAGSFTTTPGIIDHLGGLSGLRRCILPLIPYKGILPAHQELWTTKGGRFPELQTFDFEVPSLEVAANVIASLQCPVEWMSIDFPAHLYGESPAEAVPFLAKFTGSFLHHRCVSSLTMLHLMGLPNVEEGEPDAICNAFASLFSLRALQSLTIYLGCASAFDDDWYAAAAMAWPHLEDLEVNHEADDKLPRVTLAGLIPLVRYCPRLKDLSLSILAMPFNHQILPHGIRNEAIIDLGLVQSPITSPLLVFPCLMLMFPNLASIDVDLDKEECEGWEVVMDLLGMKLA